MRRVVLLGRPRDDAGEIATKAVSLHCGADGATAPETLRQKDRIVRTIWREAARLHAIVTSTEGDNPLRNPRRVKLSGNRDRWGAANGLWPAVSRL
jgi:hypothetical protein